MSDEERANALKAMEAILRCAIASFEVGTIWLLADDGRVALQQELKAEYNYWFNLLWR